MHRIYSTVPSGQRLCLSVLTLMAVLFGTTQPAALGKQSSASPASGDIEAPLDSKRVDYKADKIAQAITNEYQLLMGAGVTVQVLPLPDNQYAIVLTGEVDPTKLASLGQIAQLNRPTKYVPQQFVFNKLTGSAPTDSKIKDIGDLLATLLSKYTSGPITIKVAAVTPQPDTTAAEITKQYNQLLFGEGVDVQVQPLPLDKSHYSVVLTGAVGSSRIAALTALANSNRPKDLVPPDFLKIKLTPKTGDAKTPQQSPQEILSRTTEAVSQSHSGIVNEKRTFTETKATVPAPDSASQTAADSAKAYSVFLSGTVSDSDVKAINCAENDLMNAIKNQFGVTVNSINSDQLTTLTHAVWPITFMHGDVPHPTPAGLDTAASTASASSAPTTPEQIATALTTVFGKDVAITPYGHDLFLQGESSKVRQVRSLLAKWIDIPFPQVRMDVWTIQVNTNSTHGAHKEAAQQRMVTIRQSIQLIRDLKTTLVDTLMNFVQRKDKRDTIMAAYDAPPSHDGIVARLRPDPANRDGLLKLSQLMDNAGFDRDPLHPMSLAELFVYLALCNPEQLDGKDNSGSLTQVLHDAFTNFCDNAKAELKESGSDSDTEKTRKCCLRELICRIRDVADAKSSIGVTQDGSKAGQPGILPRFTEAMALSDKLSTWKGIYDFFYYWDYSADSLVPNDDGPEQLTRASAGADFMLRSAATALNTDLEDLSTQPLLRWIRDTVQRDDSGSGIDIVGNTSIVVSSRLPAQVVASAESYFPFTPRARLSLDDLKSAQTLSQGAKTGGAQTGTTTTTTDTKSGTTTTGSDTQTQQSTDVGTTTTSDILTKVGKTALTALGTISPLQALAVQAVFSAEPDTVYNKVGPGISLGVRPTVLRDGNSARLQLNLITNDTADQPTNPKTSGAPVDLIRGHSLETDVAVQALDLFELSTFAMETTRPGGPQWRIPVLEMLPVIGRYFDGPPSHETKHQESLILVNVTVVPRSLDLAGGYGATTTR